MRKKRNYAREHTPDLKYKSVALGRFINYVMQDGKKVVAEKIVYEALDIIKKAGGEAEVNPLATFDKAFENASPMVEVVSKRIGGANYQVPREVRPVRKFMLAARWIIDAARNKTGKPMAEKLAEELAMAANKEVSANANRQQANCVA